MPKSRREFLTHTSLGLLGAAIASQADAQQPAELPPGAPPAFGTAPPVGPEVSADTFAQAEKLVEVELSAAERAQAASNWRNSMAPLYERRMGPRKVAIETACAAVVAMGSSSAGSSGIAAAQCSLSAARA